MSLGSSNLENVFQMERLVLRKHLQQDKRAALHAVARMFGDYAVPYAITGGLAAQLYTDQPRMTMDVDVVSLREPFETLRVAEPWARYGLELIFDRRRFIKLRHVSSNVEIDINVDTRFARLLGELLIESIDGQDIAFVSAAGIAFAKLRTQRSDWPRDPAKRLQDRADLIRMMRGQPALLVTLRQDSEVTDEMRHILSEIERDLHAGDDLPPDPADVS